MKKTIIFGIVFLILIIFIIGCTKQIEEKKETLPTPPEKAAEGNVEKKAEENVSQKILEKTAENIINDSEKAKKETQTNWPMFHGNEARTGFSISKAPSKPNVVWKWTFDDFMKAGYNRNFEMPWIIVNNNNALIAPGDIFSLSLKTGEKIWMYVGGYEFYPRGLAAGDGKVFVSANTGDNIHNLPPAWIYALDESTGKLLWKYQTKKGISHALPLFADGRVFIGDDSGAMYALDAGTGNLIWKKQLDAEVIHSSAAFDNGVIFVGTEGSARSNAMPSYLYALKASDGSELWKFKVDYIQGKLNLIHSTPSVLDGVVYVGSENGYFYAVSADNGELIWKNLIASGSEELIGTSAAAALGYGKVFIGTYEGKFLAMDQKDGKIIWEYNFGKANADSSPVLADNKVYFGAEGGHFYSFDADNGEVIWKEKFGKSSAALASGILIVHNALAEDNLNPNTPIIIAFSDEGKDSLWQ